MSEYPKMLYRLGTEMSFEGKMLDTLIVGAADEEDVARDAGFGDLARALSAEPEDKPAGDILDGTAPEITAALPGMDDDALLALLEAEEAGKTRKGVIAAIKAEIERR